MKKTNSITRFLKQGSTALIAILMIVAMVVPPVNAQQVPTGRIMGKILNQETGEPLIGAIVMVEGTKIGAQADLDGNYVISNVPVGTQVVIVQSVGFAKLRIEKVEVTSGQTAKLDFALKSEAVVGEQVVVEATRLNNTEASLLTSRQKAPAAQDAISAEAMSRSGASDAASAMTRITGASVVDGKTAVIRGLSGRYSNTQLNGAQLPSTDPDKPAVQMDLIPAGLLDNITVQKTFTPDQQGNFSGGSVNLNTKDLPEKLTLKLTTSTSYNSNTTFKDDVLTHSGGPKEWLGFDDGFGDAPQILRDSNFSTVGGYTTRMDSRNASGAQYLDSVSRSLNRDFSFSERKAPLNQGYSLAFGNLYQMFDRPLGVLASLTYNRNTNYSPDGVYRHFQPVFSNGELRGMSYWQDYGDRRTTEEVLWGGLISTNLSINQSNKLRFTFNRNQHGEKTSRYLEGYWVYYFNPDQPQKIRSSSFQYTERSMQSFQYGGDHSIKLPLLNRARLEWDASFSTNQQDDPDLRFWTDTATLDSNGNVVAADIVSGYPAPTHYFRYLTERNRELKADLSIPLSFAREGSKVKLGIVSLDKDRNQDNWMMRLQPTQSPGYFIGFTDPTQVLTDDKIGIVDSTFDTYTNSWRYKWGIVAENQSRKTDTYTGEQDVFAYYGMIDWNVNSMFEIITGVRVENTNQWVQTLDTASIQDFRGEYETSDILPSLNLVFHAMPNMNVRGAYSMTLARPTIREMAPFYSFEFLTGNNNIGNTKLTRTLIRNWDLRWEWFTRPGEVVAVSGFYKRFSEPIERFVQSENHDIKFLNVPHATVYGAELEFRRRLDHTGIDFLSNFQLGGNLTLAHSEVDIDPTELSFRLGNGLVDSSETTRPFGGQSPFVLNLDLVYNNQNTGTEIALLYNIFGDRLAEVGYQSPDIFEKSRQQVDVSISQQIIGGVVAKVSGKNLLNEDKTFIQTAGDTEYIRSLQREGRLFGFSLSYAL